MLASGEVVQFETEVQTAGDTIRWYANRMGPITRDGRIEGVMLLNRDITRAKSVEHQIRSSLLEKETLLREIHHRVKNNLQVISSLLDLQGEGIREPHLLQALAESRNRVRAMALIHQELYQSESLSRIDTSGYIRGLVTHLFRAYHLQDADISLDIRVDGISLGLDMAIPCGLIINELVTNALKYAFPPGHSGILRIHLESESPGRYSLTIGDNGCGLPESLDLDNPPSLGLRLVQLLTRQLGGNLEIDRTGGTTFRLIFSETTNRQLR